MVGNKNNTIIDEVENVPRHNVPRQCRWTTSETCGQDKKKQRNV